LGAAGDGLGNLCLHGPLSEVRRAFGIAIEAKTVWVNRNGERFMEESSSFSPFESANGVLRQPGQTCFSLFDEAILQNAIKNGMDRPFESSLHSRPQNDPKLDTILGEEAKLDHLKISNSWDEIAGWMGVNSAALKDTIREYNTDCERGRDHLFAKDPIHLKPLRNPPFYSIRCSVGYLSTLGGIKINHRMEVLNKQSKPIRGLYAGGNDAGGFSGSTYNAHLAGTGCGFAFNSGRIAGENAAKYVS
jgi:fumarate reductase flavoprotein subunit